ncbi:MAG TPA: beta-ketoacyl reductase, partial [Nocardiopsis listeri]|uniref:beta-ketoacyl reductase n=1 Tax=Nocardiopsis listeri TaxID=53440 RepID=UPI001DC7D534
GAQVARWLAELGVPRLVLTSRRGSGAPGAPELERELRALGAEVEITACDAGDATALAHIKERSAKEGFPVRTVFHMAGAGVLRGLADTDVEEFAATTHAKIAGADALDQVFSEPGELDDFVLFSSVSAAWGSGEHGAYACANAYLDGFAEHRRGRGLAARSVVWGIWSPDEGGGMAADLVEEQLRSRGIPFMDPKAALEGFHRVLEGGPVVEVLADVDWSRFAPVFTMARPSPLITTVPEARAALLTEEPKEAEASLGSLADRLVTLSPAQRERELSDLVRTQIAAVLQYTGPDDVDPERALRELGFDSLTAVDLRNRLGGATGLRLPVTIVFDHPDADSLTAHLDGLLVPDPRGDVEAPPGRAPEVGLDDPDEVNDMDIDSLVRLAMQNETDEGVK